MGFYHGVESHWKNSIAMNLNHEFFFFFLEYLLSIKFLGFRKD